MKELDRSLYIYVQVAKLFLVITICFCRAMAMPILAQPTIIITNEDNNATEINGELIIQLKKNPESGTKKNVKNNIKRKLQRGSKIAFGDLFGGIAAPHPNITCELISENLNIILLSVPDGTDIQPLIDVLQRQPNVKVVQKNHRTSYRNDPLIPNDNEFDRQWDMEIIQAPLAWGLTTNVGEMDGLTFAGDTIVIAVIDDGFDNQHEDLRANWWYNWSEIPDDGLDNDNNGYIDDFRGWSIQNGNDQHPLLNHGTAVAGIIGASGDNAVGVAGVNWNIKIMRLSNAITEAEVVQAYDYILEQRQLYNASLGERGAYVVATSIAQGFAGNPNNHPIWCNIYDTLGELGILSVAATVNSSINVDVQPDIPTSCPSHFLISVTNTDQNDELRSTAGFGANSIDIGAPGSGSFTTNAPNTYGTFSGTSAATPHVAGAVGLMYALKRSEFDYARIVNARSTALDIRHFIDRGADPLPSLENKVAFNGRLNVYNSLSLLDDYYKGFSDQFRLNAIYPNPVSDRLYVDYENTGGEFQILIYNQLGQLVLESGGNGYRTISIWVNELSAGVHWFILKNETDQFIQPFIKY